MPAASATAAAGSSAKAGLAARRKVSGLSAMAVAAKSARVHAALSAWLGISASGVCVSVKRPDGCARTVVNSAAPGISSAACPSAVVTAPVIKGSAPRVVPAMVINRVSAMPVESPVSPAPSKAAKPPNAKSDAEGKVRAAKPDSGIRVPPRPGYDGISINQPGIVGGNINHVGLCRRNLYVRAVGRYGLLWGGLQITC